LSLFGNRNATSPQDQRTSASTIVPGVKIDVSNLVPTTKFESCSDELKKEIEGIDTFILNQIRLCNEVSDFLPMIASQGALVPNDVEFVQGKLDTLQQALENDASDIEEVRNLVTRDANDAKLCFRALDTLFLPLQYQPAPGERWWSPNQQASSMQRYSLRSALGTRQNLLALPGDSETDSSVAATGGPTNLVDYFSQRADEMNNVLDKYRQTLKEIEGHLGGVEVSLTRQINDAAACRSRESGSGALQPTSRSSELAATLRDVEMAILGVAGRLGNIKEQGQELILGPVLVGGNNG
jgi:nucleoporin p58/p45